MNRFSHVAQPGLELIQQIESTSWRVGLATPSLTVWYGRPKGCPVVTYRTVTEVDQTMDVVFDFFGPRMLDAFSVLNRRFAFAETLSADPWIVRTGFSMPAPFTSREFLHEVAAERHSDILATVCYVPVAHESAFPAPRQGYIRCPIYLSGQRIRRLPDGRVRIEHTMGYRLAGNVPTTVQNTVFHKGHLQAYFDEWNGLGDQLAHHASTMGGSP